MKKNALRKKQGEKSKPILTFRREDIFTRYPPITHLADWGPLPSALTHAEFTDAYAEQSARLAIVRDDYRKTKNPRNILEALYVCHEIGFYPPMWAQEELLKIFEEFYNSQGMTTLDKLFGFKMGRGKDSFWKETEVYYRDWNLMNLLLKLRQLKFKLSAAVHMVHEHPRNKKGYMVGKITIDPLKESYIKRMWTTKWSKKFNTPPYKEQSLKWVTENEQKFLSQFPKESFPPDRQKVP